MASYYECKRCFHKFSQKNDISRHLNRKKECNRALLSYQLYDDYDSEALTELSFIKIKSTRTIEKTSNYNVRRYNIT